MGMLPLPTMVDTTATHTDAMVDTEDTMVDTTAILTDMELTDMPTTLLARGLLMPKLKLILHTCTLVPTATLILMDTDTELSLPTMPPALATNTFPLLLPPMVSLNSTKDLLMPNLRLMLPLPTMVDTMAIPDTDTTVSDTDMVVIMAVTDTVVSATTVKL